MRFAAAAVAALILLARIGPAGAAEFSAELLVAEPGHTFVEQAVGIGAAGNYEIVLQDLAVPAALATVSLAATAGGELLGRIDAPGTLPFEADAAGDVLVRVVGQPGTGQERGRVRLIVRQAGGGSTVADFQADIADLGDAGTSGQVSFNSTFDVQQAGTHDCRLSDLAFPEDLLELEVTVSRGDQPVCSLSATAPTAQFDGVAGSYSVVAHARARSGTGAGLFGLEVARGGQAVYHAAVPVGALGEATPVALTPSGAYSLALVDQGFPAALTSLSAILLQVIDAIGRQDSAGTANFNATAGDAELYAFAATTASSGGAYGIDLTGPGGSLFSDVRTVAGPDPGSGDQAVHQFRVELQSGGAYSLDLSDFEFRAPFQSLEVVVTQGSQLLGTTSAGQPLAFNASPGFLVLTVVSKLASADAISLFGLRLIATSDGSVVFEQTQASGSEFKAYAFDVATAGSYDVELADLDFPATFGDLSAAVTRGTERLGFVFGAGRFSFDAVPGRYFISVVAAPGAASRYGLYTVTADPTPPAPVVDLAAASTTIDAGDSVRLTWSSTGATQCAASGGWTGQRALSGDETVGPLSARTVFRLSCMGDGGTTESTVTVDVRSNSGSGGGGASGGGALLMLTALALARRRRAFRAAA